MAITKRASSGGKRKSKDHNSGGATVDGRTKAASIFLREERKSDKRQTLADALAANLRGKYAKHDPEFGESINSMTFRLVLHTQRRIVESDIVALEAVVRKMSQEREAKRNSAAAAKSAGGLRGGPVGGGGGGEGGGRSGGGGGGGGGPGVQQIDGSRHASSSLAQELQGQDEWVLLNALTLVEFEKDADSAKRRHAEKQRMQRAWLDAQRAEKQSLQSHVVQQQHSHFAHQERDIHKWRSEESLKKQKQQEQVLKVRAERDEQLRQQKLRQEQEDAARKRDDHEELQKVQRELEKVEQTALLRRQQDHERMKKLQEETAKDQAIKSRIKLQEMDNDVQLMEAYARRLAKEEENRMKMLQGKLKKRDMAQFNIAATLQEQQRLKQQELERRSEEYQRKKDDEARTKERDQAERRRREALERKQFLELQRHQKKEREHKEVEEDYVYAAHVQRDGKAAVEEQKTKAQQLRERNLKEQERLLQQMREQKQGQPLTSLHLPRTLMNSREKHINATLLNKLEDTDVAQRVLQKLSPSKEQKEYTIATSFY